MGKKISDPNVRILSDGKNYIIANEDSNMAAWIWTKDNIDDALLPELKEAMDEFIISDKTPFTCKKEIYNKLKANYCDMLNANDYFEVGFMKCDFLRSVKENDGILSRARIEERELIANI